MRTGLIMIGATRLSGLVLHQTYRYFHLYPEDALYLKLMVCDHFLRRGTKLTTRARWEDCCTCAHPVLATEL